MIGSCPCPGDSYGMTCGPGAAGGPVWSPVAAGATSGQTQQAIDDAGDESVVLSLDGATNDSPTYSPQGLLDSFVQAGTPLADIGSTTPCGSGEASGLASGVQSEDGAVLGAEDADGVPGASPAGNYQSLWGNALRSDPGLSGTVATDALNQGLVSTLSVIV